MEEGFVDESHRARAHTHTHTGPPMEEGFVDESYVLPAVTRSSPFPPFPGGFFSLVRCHQYPLFSHICRVFFSFNMGGLQVLDYAVLLIYQVWRSPRRD